MNTPSAIRLSVSALVLALVSAGCGGNKACCKGGANSPCAHPAEGGEKHEEHHAGAESFKMLSLAEFDALRAANAKGTFVFDANGPDSYKAGHIPGAVWVAHDGVKAELLPADKNANLVFYCANPKCGASHQAAKSAAALGYANVFVLPEGIDGWKKAARATEAGK